MKLLLTIPTYNEELVIEANMRTAYAACERLFGDHDWTLLVADNGSSDQTQEIVQELKKTLSRLALWSTTKKGRGHALRTVWQETEADVYAYMDADLATDLAHLPELISSLQDHHLAVGSRFGNESVVGRSLFREFISRTYRFIAHALVPMSVRDLQCGFKAIRADAAKILLPATSHDGWFFDTELIAHAEAQGYRIKEIPVRWEESRDLRRKSSVKIFQTAWDDFKHLWKLRRRLKAFSTQSEAGVRPDVLS